MVGKSTFSSLQEKESTAPNFQPDRNTLQSNTEVLHRAEVVQDVLLQFQVVILLLVVNVSPYQNTEDVFKEDETTVVSGIQNGTVGDVQ
jgi:hypothetical protein